MSLLPPPDVHMEIVSIQLTLLHLPPFQKQVNAQCGTNNASATQHPSQKHELPPDLNRGCGMCLSASKPHVLTARLRDKR